MDKLKSPNWFVKNPPIYDITKSYAENAASGPFYTKVIPERKAVDKNNYIHFLGHAIKSPIGVAAGPLLNSNWINLAAQLGFDILTYKTIRSYKNQGHALPNMIYVNLKEDHAVQIDMPHETLEDLTLTNSFGMPSQSRDFLLYDIAKAKASLVPGQVLIVSVVGSQTNDTSLLQDFIDTALLAKEAGASIIEANFSCPNVAEMHSQLYLDPENVYQFAKALKTAIAPLPLVIKVGNFPSYEHLKKVVIAAAKANVDAICGLNSLGRPVFTKDSQPALGIHRPTSGICGGQIRKFALEFVQNAFQVKKEEKLDITIMGVGGITLAEHFDEFFKYGADIALCATGMIFDPLLAYQYHSKRGIHAVG
ncbi:MAG: dihydroorotate dehydrogenase [Chlamydiota bacterium]